MESFFQLFFPIEFNNVRNNQRRVEVRFLHAKLAHFLRKIILHPSINSGTYHTFRGEENFYGPPIIRTALTGGSQLGQRFRAQWLPNKQNFFGKGGVRNHKLCWFLDYDSLKHLSKLGLNIVSIAELKMKIVNRHSIRSSNQSQTKNAKLPENGFTIELWVKWHFSKTLQNNDKPS